MPWGWIVGAVGSVLPSVVRRIKTQIAEKNAQPGGKIVSSAEPVGKTLSPAPVDASELGPIAKSTPVDLPTRLQTRYPDLFLEWRKFEDEDLAMAGANAVAGGKWDPLAKIPECGFGVTLGEIEDAKTYGILAPSYPNQLPKFKCYLDALHWFQNVTVPTYLAMVESEVILKGVKLSDYERIALASFAQNLGRHNLRQLVTGPIRLLEGVRGSMRDLIPRYCRAGGEVVKGLIRRRSWEVEVFYTKETV